VLLNTKILGERSLKITAKVVNALSLSSVITHILRKPLYFRSRDGSLGTAMDGMVGVGLQQRQGISAYPLHPNLFWVPPTFVSIEYWGVFP
jgi:hypothetical protein